jgi:cell division protein FtsI/penicillin-binding protein 2
MMRGFCCLVNGGRLVKPQVVRGVVSNTGEVVKNFGQVRHSLERESENAWGRIPQMTNERVISGEVSGQMVDKALVEVVSRQGGTANKASLEGYRVFGKTGTAQVPKKDGRGYEEGKYVSSFIAGAPAEDPQVCVLVMVREPDKSLGLGYTGGRVAAPAVREILRQSLAYLGVPMGRKDEGKRGRGAER